MPIQYPDKTHFIGALIGQCVGDALGFPVEGCPPEYCRKYWNEIVLTEKIIGKDLGYGLRFGQYTDDSQLARELLQSYVEMGKVDPQNYAKHIAAIFKEQRIVGKGRATEQAAIKLINGCSWDTSGTPSPAAGNGSAMRAAPIGLICFDNFDMLVDFATKQGIITHQDKRSSAGAIVIAGATAIALKNDIDNNFYFKLAELTKNTDPILSDFIENHLPSIVPLKPDEALGHIYRVGMESDYQDGWDGISPFVTPSVLWSLYSFLHSPQSYLETVSTAIYGGGDVDTTAAMAGAISGAYLGIDAIPSKYRNLLTDKGTWEYSDLVILAEEAYNIKIGCVPSP